MCRILFFIFDSESNSWHKSKTSMESGILSSYFRGSRKIPERKLLINHCKSKDIVSTCFFQEKMLISQTLLEIQVFQHMTRI